MKLSEIYEILELKFEGEEREITALNSLANAKNSELSYCDGEKNAKFIANSKAGAILVGENLKEFVPANMHAIVVENAHLAFAILSKFFAKELFASSPKEAQISPSAKVMQNVYIGSGVTVGEGSVLMPGVFLGDNVKIGKNCILHPNVVVYNDCVIGDECHINANAVIGSDGYGYAHTKTGEHIKIYHNGNVILEDFVEIGACTTIDRGVFEPTIIKRHTKIDNLVQIGHNCELGQGCLIVAQTGLAGSSKLGRNVVMGGQSGTTGHLKVGDFAQIAARGGVSKSIEGGKKYAGAYPILELGEFFKMQAKILRFFKK
ncbi:UDP-3-O-(3-hydroxymyristoyl)glucosamine N-acyltransferase [Campylobacter sp. RM16187]|uniref:UDP-3-O-(3-hydroxymyristoyl)glucosamine N-acyltransferase n=1 Tax=Campylobacter sp. RM16187 TaxID=1660063 RepID=UPI0021B6C3D9|nr:UDP-3-O-(3-hydroxymyristoyl)glucosamine N-acyltransferase [Campylobacter sp. RM16187]QKG29336.1 UDP-3-O-(R-3-hydroxymyristoyl)-glucosamine N-acyltransferase [Campylobacter sp. RM16187]